MALLTLAHGGDSIVLQRNAHSSTVDALVLSGLRPTFAAPELDPDLHIAHGLRPETLDRALAETPGAAGAAVVSPTYFGAVADVAALAEVAHGHGVPLIVDESWGAHLAFSDELPEHALALGADLVISSIHKIVGSLTQSAMVHLGQGDLIDEDVVDRCVTLVESTSPNALLGASLDSARRCAAIDGRALLADAARAGAHPRGGARGARLDVLDERLVGAAGVFAYDPLRLTVDVRGTRTSGYELARLLREQDVHVELAGENVMVAVFGMGGGHRGHRRAAGRGAAPRGRGAERARARPRARGVRAAAAVGRAGDVAARGVPVAPGRSCPSATPSAGSPPSRSPPTRPASPTCSPASA